MLRLDLLLVTHDMFNSDNMYRQCDIVWHLHCHKKVTALLLCVLVTCLLSGLGDEVSKCFIVSDGTNRGDGIVNCNMTDRDSYLDRGYQVRLQAESPLQPQPLAGACLCNATSCR